MALVQRGDRAAYETLYTRWRLPIFRFLLQRTCSRERAEEAHQETWMRVYRYRASFRADRPFRGWIYKIAANVGYDARSPATDYDAQAALDFAASGRDINGPGADAVLAGRARPTNAGRYFQDVHVFSVGVGWSELPWIR
mgnify:CR=1 FL=1